MMLILASALCLFLALYATNELLRLLLVVLAIALGFFFGAAYRDET